MFDSITHFMRRNSVLCGAFVCAAFLPLSAAANMDTVSNAELSGLQEMPDTGYMEFYQHPDMGSYPFKDIYLEPVANEVPRRIISDFRWRPEHVDELAADFHRRLEAAFESTGRLTDSPGEDTLIIATSLVFVNEYTEQSTGSNLGGARVQDRHRGSTIMEMTWRAGTDGPLVAAIRDGRSPQIYAPVTDRDDEWTDARDTFDVWATEFASFFRPASSAEMN